MLSLRAALPTSDSSAESPLEDKLKNPTENILKTKQQHVRNGKESAVDRLPQEILYQVLRWIQEEEEDACFPVRYAWVSKDWHALVYWSPVLWRRLDSTMSPNSLQIRLKVNQDGPLHIYSIGSRSSDRAFWDLTIPHCRRWQRWVADVFLGKVLQSLPPGSLPLLTECSLKQLWSVNLDFGDGTPLRALELSGVSTNWTIPRLSNLESIHLGRWLGHSDISDGLVGFLLSNHQLRTITLRFINIKKSHGFIFPSNMILNLPKLSHIELIGVEEPFTEWFVSSLRPSKAVRYLHVTGSLYRPLQENPAFLEVITSMIKSTQHLKVDYSEATGHFQLQSHPPPIQSQPGFDKSALTATSRGLNITFKLPFESSSFANDFVAACSGGNLPGTVELTLRDRGLFHLELSFLHAFPSMRDICLTSNYGYTTGLLLFLGRRSRKTSDSSDLQLNDHDPSSLAWPCPQLESLSIMNEWPSSPSSPASMTYDIRRFLQSRDVGVKTGQLQGNLQRLGIPRSIHKSVFCRELPRLQIWGV